MKTLLWPAGLALGLACLAAAPARAANDEQIKNAILKARAYLQASFRSGSGTGGGQHGGAFGEGPAALAGIAMLESGVSPDDPTILSIARVVREAAVSQASTYQLALDIILLDKLGEPADEPLIQSMGVRLLLGQNRNGAWTYTCPGPDDAEANRLKTVVLTAGKAKPKKDLPEPPTDIQNRPKLSPEAEDLLRRGRSNPSSNPNTAAGIEDHSNTQFAVLGLWSARRHGVPAENALALTEQHFRTCMQPEGGWGYTKDSGANTPMTCAALLALATGLGSKSEERVLRGGGGGRNPGGSDKPGDAPKPAVPQAVNPLKDPQIATGINYIGNMIAKDIAGAGQPVPQHFSPAMTAEFLGQIHFDYYTMWSIERVGMILVCRKWASMTGMPGDRTISLETRKKKGNGMEQNTAPMWIPVSRLCSCAGPIW